MTERPVPIDLLDAYALEQGTGDSVTYDLLLFFPDQQVVHVTVADWEGALPLGHLGSPKKMVLEIHKTLVCSPEEYDGELGRYEARDNHLFFTFNGRTDSSAYLRTPTHVLVDWERTGDPAYYFAYERVRCSSHPHCPRRPTWVTP